MSFAAAHGVGRGRMEVGDWWRRWCRQRSIRPWRIVSLQGWRRSRSSCMVMVMLLLLLLKLHRSNAFVAPNFHRRRLVEVQPIKSSCHGPVTKVQARYLSVLTGHSYIPGVAKVWPSKDFLRLLCQILDAQLSYL